jgi:hypothetical protein
VDQLRAEEFIECFLLPIRAEPERFSTFQIADHRDELCLLAQKYFVDSHLPQSGLAAARVPSL